MLDLLRQAITKMERPAILHTGALPVGIDAIDAVLGGGLARGALHEVAAASEAHVTAMNGFALGITGARKAVWIGHDMAFTESGAPYLFTGFPLRPEHVLVINVARTRDLLWAMEEALRCRAVTAVIGELRHQPIDAVAARRLSLAAADHNSLALLLRASPARSTSTAATRWIVEAARSRPLFGPGSPRWRAQLTRNRHGPNGEWIVEWSNDERLTLASAHPQPLARPAADRPAFAAIA